MLVKCYKYCISPYIGNHCRFYPSCSSYAVEAFQKKGIGLELVRFCEEALRGKGASGIVLHARKTAQGFYEKAGYTPVGEAFLEVGIPHQAMEKRW